MKLIIGLGNPGAKYKNTRHNIGFLVLDELAGKQKWSPSKKANAQYLKTESNGQPVILIKPQTFMNNSGSAVRYFARKEKIDRENIIVIHDDKDLEFGRIKIQIGASSAGHKGVKSIIDHLGTQDFWRIRIGIKTPETEIVGTEKFVLQNFTTEEKKEISDIIKQAIEELKKLAS